MSDIELTDSDIEVQPQQVNQRAARDAAARDAAARDAAAREAAARAAALHTELSGDESSDESSDGEYIMDDDTVAFYRTPPMAPGLYLIRPENVPDGFFKLQVDQDGRERIAFFPHDRPTQLVRTAYFRRIDNHGLGIIQEPRIHFQPIRNDPRRNER